MIKSKFIRQCSAALTVACIWLKQANIEIANIRTITAWEERSSYCCLSSPHWYGGIGQDGANIIRRYFIRSSGIFAINLLFYNYSLWAYTGIFNHTVSDIAVAVVLFPCTVNVYLTHFPQKMAWAPPYILGWTAFAIILENIAVQAGHLAYEHGWNLSGPHGCACARLR